MAAIVARQREIMTQISELQAEASTLDARAKQLQSNLAKRLVYEPDPGDKTQAERLLTLDHTCCCSHSNLSTKKGSPQEGVLV